MEMKEKNNERIKAKVSTRDLIALCYIIDDFDKFNNNLTEYLAQKPNCKIGSIVYKLEKMSRDTFTFCSKDLSNFYQENKKVINTINNQTNLNMFICTNYNEQGCVYPNFANAAKYIKNNKDELKTIIALLENLYHLSFYIIELDEDIDFTKEKYEVDKTFRKNKSISYVDNIKIIPSYEANVVQYETNDSNYRMGLRVSQNGFSRYNRKITLKSLNFDFRELPKTISEETIFAQLVELASCREKEQRVLKNLVDLEVNIDDLINQFDQSVNNINNLGIATSQEMLIERLHQIKTELILLKQFNDEYEEEMLQKYPRLSSENVRNAKCLYLQKRTSSHIS